VKRMLSGLLTMFAIATGLLVAVPANAAPASATPVADAPVATSSCPFANPRHVWPPTKYFMPNECYSTPGGTIVVQADGTARAAVMLIGRSCGRLTPHRVPPPGSGQ